MPYWKMTSTQGRVHVVCPRSIVRLELKSDLRGSTNHTCVGMLVLESLLPSLVNHMWVTLLTLGNPTECVGCSEFFT